VLLYLIYNIIKRSSTKVVQIMPLGFSIIGSTVTFDLLLRWATQGPLGPLVSVDSRRLKNCTIIVLKRINGNLYDPVSYLNFQYHTETDQWKCVRPCILLNCSVSYWNGPMGIWTTLYRTKPFSNRPMGMCTTLYRTKIFSIVLKRPYRNLYDPVSYSNFQYCTETDQSESVRPCIVLNHSVPY